MEVNLGSGPHDRIAQDSLPGCFRHTQAAAVVKAMIYLSNSENCLYRFVYLTKPLR